MSSSTQYGQNWRQMFPAIATNTDYCSSVDEANFRRVLGLLEDAMDKGAQR